MELKKQINSWEDIVLETRPEKIPLIIEGVLNVMLIFTLSFGALAYFIKDIVMFFIFIGFLLMHIILFIEFGLGAENTEYIITDKKIYTKVGLYPIFQTVPIEDIKEIKIQRQFLNKIYKTGTIMITYVKSKDPEFCQTIFLNHIKDYEKVLDVIPD